VKAGFSKEVITPPVGISMGGYRLRREAARGVHDDLEARCAVLDDGSSTYALVALDLLGLDYRQTARMKEKIAAECGLQPERILAACTHTHSGPDTLGLSGSGEEQGGYYQETYERAAGCVRAALARVEPVVVSLAQTAVPGLGFNRRIVLGDGSAHLNLERLDESRIAARGPVDPDASLLLFDRGEQTLGGISNFTLHATVLNEDNLLFTRDWPGYLVDGLEATLAGRPVVLFFNGAFGNINQIKTPGRWISTFREAKRIGETIAERLSGAVESRRFLGEAEQEPAKEARQETGRQTRQEPAVAWQHSWITVPRRKARGDTRIQRDIARVQAQLAAAEGGDLAEIERLRKELMFLREEQELGRGPEQERMEIQRITMGEIEIIGLPGEIFVEYGLELKRSSPKGHCLIFGNANGSAGYVPLPGSFQEGGYETRLSRGSRLAPEAGTLILRAVENLRRETSRRQA
jgi:hypothetical protein